MKKTRNSSNIKIKRLIPLAISFLMAISSLSLQPASFASSAYATVKDGVYTISNKKSGYMMSVSDGKDADGTRAMARKFDGSSSQQFNVKYVGSGKYLIYAMSSSSGTNRVLDIYRGNSRVAASQYMDIWIPNDKQAQEFYINPQSDGSFTFEAASRQGTVIGFKKSTSAGTRLQIQNCKGTDSQKWYFKDIANKAVNPKASSPLADSNGSINANSSSDSNASTVPSTPGQAVQETTSPAVPEKIPVTVPPNFPSPDTIIKDGIYTISNKSSGYMMNIDAGVDADGTRAIASQFTGSAEQQFKVKYMGSGKYLIYAACSSGGANRVLDIYRGNSLVSAFQPLDIWIPNDSLAQEFYINPQSDGTYTFEVASLPGNVIGCASALTNGAGLQVQPFKGEDSQKWLFKDTSNLAVDPKLNVSYSLPASSASDNFQFPVGGLNFMPFRITQNYADYRASGLYGNKYHVGIDIGVPANTPVKATASGIVIVSESNKRGWGNVIMIRHYTNGGYIHSLYAHLNSLSVNVGDVVTGGTVIGLSGSTGNSTGNHLHFEIKGANNGTLGLGDLSVHPDRAGFMNPLIFINSF
jgi:murein DD-endopeptidase MepM/ murein hydrolase activator NlpD